MDGLTGKVVIITGASEGIGRALAVAMARMGCQLVLSARNETRLASLALEIANYGPPPFVFAADVSSPEQCEALVEAAVAHYGHLDILINNAGMTMWSRFDALTQLSVLEDIMRVNYLGPAYLTHAALPHLKASKGQVVVVASVAGLTGVPTRSGYAASKHALEGYFKALRYELTEFI